MTVAAAAPWDVLAAELVDTLQADRASRDLPFHVRTLETRRDWPRLNSRATPRLLCAYCGRKRCVEHADLPALDPFYGGAT